MLEAPTLRISAMQRPGLPFPHSAHSPDNPFVKLEKTALPGTWSAGEGWAEGRGQGPALAPCSAMCWPSRL